MLILAAGLALATMDRWLMAALDPGPFDPEATPPAPDYAAASAWAALPEVEDGADVTLAALEAVDQREAEAAVFYIHPTTWLGRAWNAAIDDPAVVEAVEIGGTRIQASVFNGCCAVHAPRYRQVNGRAFVHPSAAGDRALEVAYADVSAAFDRFLAEIGERPFIVAGHSQGAAIGARLVGERVAGSELEDRLVAAYLIGTPTPAAAIGLPVCDTPTRTGCVVGWNARGPNYVPNGLEFDSGSADPLADAVCVNPLSWTTDGARVPAEANAGALFFDIAEPVIEPGFADAQCVDGVLVIRELGELERDFMSRLLLWVMGPENYHPIEYQLFYLNLRRNARARVEAWLGS